jgi:hypothetical protein
VIQIMPVPCRAGRTRGQSPFGVSAPRRKGSNWLMTKAIKRSEVIHVRLTVDERARFTERCAPDELPISEAIRRVMREAAELGPSFDGEIADEIRGLTRQLRAIGGDIDRVVRDINVGNTPEAATMRTTFVEFAEVLWEVESFYRSLCANARARHSQAAKVS